MMKKNGFTLAEVLITLAIIGVVATLTLPSLMANTQEQQAVTGFRKAMNTLNEVAQMNAAVDGFDYSSINATTAPGNDTIYDSNGLLDQSIWGMMASKAQVNAKQSGGAGTIQGECASLSVIMFRDGTALCYNASDQTNAADANITAYVDTNGRKAPNQISKCNSLNCITASGKKIKDQFKITLKGSVAIPYDGSSEEANAAQWAMSK